MSSINRLQNVLRTVGDRYFADGIKRHATVVVVPLALNPSRYSFHLEERGINRTTKV
jgi:hypothetical protein